MKRFPAVVISVLLALSLAGCGGQDAPRPFDPEADAQALTEAQGVFSAPMTAIDADVACALYGIDENTVTGCAAYGATATSAEELALFIFDSEDSAQAAAKLLQLRIEDRTEELKDYLPDELPKLEKARVEQRGATALLLVCADYDTAGALLE